MADPTEIDFGMVPDSNPQYQSHYDLTLLDRPIDLEICLGVKGTQEALGE